MFRYCSPRSAARAAPPSAQLHAMAGRSGLAARRAVRGFTLVELMVTLAVAAILMVIAIPSFKNITLSNELSTTANALVNSINVARMEAVKRNNYAQFCSDTAANNGSDTLGTACSTATYKAGAVVLMEDSTTNTTYLAQQGTDKLTAPLQVSGTISAIRFDGQGLGYPIGGTGVMNGTVADICTSAMGSDNHRVITITTGTIVTTTTTSGSCP